jgi:hypothetical protein
VLTGFKIADISFQVPVVENVIFKGLYIQVFDPSLRSPSTMDLLHQKRTVHLHILRQSSIVFTFALIFLYFMNLGILHFIDAAALILFTEYNRVSNKRTLRYVSGHSESSSLDPSVIATVVGYREDKAVFKRVLQSYQNAVKPIFLIVAIDGTDDDDLEMQQVFEEVSNHLQ